MFKPKKMFGQNFLVDYNVAAKIVRTAELQQGDEVWEIGAGKGILTAELLKTGCRLICFEIDRDLINELQERFGKSIDLIPKDVLKADWDKIISDIRTRLNRKPRITLVANIPYNITSPLLYKITDYKEFFSKIVIMLQKEVADRIIASPGSKSYGVMSLKIRHYFDVHRLFKVPRHLFRPQPGVDSEVIRLVPRQEEVKLERPDLFWQIVETAFQSRRKTLKNNLTRILSQKELELLEKMLEEKNFEIIEDTGIKIDKPISYSMRQRGESLDEKDFIILYHLIRYVRNSDIE